jgi:transposase-like protein
VIELARQPGASVAAVALANGLNANMLRRWVHEAVAGPPTVPRPADITVEIHRGDTTVNARLPMDERSAAWLREVLG